MPDFAVWASRQIVGVPVVGVTLAHIVNQAIRLCGGIFPMLGLAT
jgi:hypothetical protein